MISKDTTALTSILYATIASLRGNHIQFCNLFHLFIHSIQHITITSFSRKSICFECSLCVCGCQEIFRGFSISILVSIQVRLIISVSLDNISLYLHPLKLLSHVFLHLLKKHHINIFFHLLFHSPR